MVKYLLGLASGVALVFLIVVFVALLAWAAGMSGPSVADDSILTVRLAGNLPEHVASEFSLATLGGKTPITLLGATRAIRKAGEDDRIRALALKLDGVGLGWAKSQEMRWAIEAFRESGKPVYAHIEVGGTLDYFVGSAAGKLYMPPEGVLNVKGLRAEVSFYKDTLDKLGAVVEMAHVGQYKSAVEPYTRNNMSDSFREVTNALLDEIYQQFLESSASGREISAEELRAAIDDGPFLPQQALDHGLIDGLLYEDEFYDQLAEVIEVEDPERISVSEYAAAIAEPFSDGKKIAVLFSVGSIMRGKSQVDPFFQSRTLGSSSFAETVKRIEEDDEIEAVILRINSPGGDAIASDRMWRDVNRLAAEKPVVVSMSNVAASGGYYMAMASEVPIVAYPGTYTGSIGVFFGKLNLRGFYDKIGLRKEILTRGRFAAIDSDYTPLEGAEREKVQESVEAVYHSFVAKAAEARGRSWDEIHEVAQGRVWLGSQALEVGLIDEVGGFEKALAMAREAAEIGEDEAVQLISYPAPRPFLESLIDQGQFGARPALPEILRAKLGAASPWPALIEGGMLALAPYNLTIE